MAGRSYSETEYERMRAAVKAACTRCKLDGANQIAELRAQTFLASCGKFDSLNFETICVFLYATSMKRLRAHLRDMAQAIQLASFTHGLN
jgi:hypothetical protein